MKQHVVPFGDPNVNLYTTKITGKGDNPKLNPKQTLLGTFDTMNSLIGSGPFVERLVCLREMP